MATDARAVVLGRIRAALSATEASDAQRIAAEWTTLRRDYRRTPAHDAAGQLDLFEDRLRDYDAGVYRCAPAEIAATVARILVERGKRRIALPLGIPPEWLTNASGIDFFVDEGGGIETIDSCDGVLTGATVAIAETGTIVLQEGPGQGRRAVTLLPDYHLCIVEAGRIVETVPQAMDRLHPTAHLATTFFSGPSATADIEMTRIKGVHGPRFVDVILVLNPAV